MKRFYHFALKRLIVHHMTHQNDFHSRRNDIDRPLHLQQMRNMAVYIEYGTAVL